MKTKRILIIIFALVIFSTIGHFVFADTFSNGAKGSIFIDNQSTVIKDTNGDKMSVAVNVNLASGGTASQFTLPIGNPDTSISVELLPSDGKKVWVVESVGMFQNVPVTSNVSLRVPSPISKTDYYKAFPDPNLPGNMVKVFIRGDVTKKLYYESDAFRLFTYDRPFSLKSISPMFVLLGEKLTITGSDFKKENIKGIYLFQNSIPWTVISQTQIEATIPFVLKTGRYTVHVISADELFDVSYPEDITIVNMIVKDVTPLSPLKGTTIKLTGSGFFENKIDNVYIGDATVPWKLVDSTEIEVTVPNTIPNGEYEVYIRGTDLEKYPAPYKITVANITITSIDPVEITKSTRGNVSFFINGAGFLKDKIAAIYVGSTEMDWRIVSELRIEVFVPSDFPANTYQVGINTTDGFQVLANDKLVVKDSGSSTTSTTNTNTTSGSGIISSIKEFAGGIVPDCNRGAVNPTTGKFATECDFNQLLTLINRLINFLLVYFATPLAAIIFVYAGFIYLTSGGSSEKASRAKHMLGTMVLGYIIALAAWLIVKTILMTLGFDGDYSFLAK